MDEDEDYTSEEEIKYLRCKFKEKYEDDVENGEYDDADMERFNTDDVYASRFYLHQKRDVEKAIVMVDSSLRWRKSMDLNNLTDASFPRWMHELGGVFYHKTDNNGHPLLHFQVAKNKKDPDNLSLIKQFVAWWIDKTYKKTPENSIVVLFDMNGTGLSNMDIDLIKFQITCFTTYFPYYLEYMLIYEMPWVLNAIWNIIKNILTAEQQKRVIFVRKAEISKYINKDSMFTHMGGSDTFVYDYLPSEDSGIDITHNDLLTNNAEDNHFATATSGSILRKRVTFSEKKDSQYPAADTDNEPIDTGDKASMIGPVFRGTMATISPAEQFMFNVSDDTKETMDLLTLKNITSKQIAFKVKTTTPDNYRVRPSTSLIQPGNTAVISVYLQPGCYDTINRDKFLVMVIEVDDDVSSASEIADRWRSPPQDKTKYMEHRLYCAIKYVRFDEESGLAIKSKDRPNSTEVVLANINKKMGPSYSNLDSKSSEVLDVMLVQQDQLERNLSRLFKFQIFVVFLVVAVVILFMMVYVMEWRIVDSYTEVIQTCVKPSQTSSQ